MKRQSAFAIIVAIIPSSAFADISTPVKLKNEPVMSTEDIVVTARKSSENVQKVPIAISVFSADRLSNLNARNIADIARVTPSFYMQTASGDPNASLVTIRGASQVDQLLTTDPSVGIYIDGIYLPRTLGIKAALLDVERVEVLKGPQGTLYGRNTTGGAISIISHKPSLDRIDGFLTVNGGNYGSFNVTGAVSLPLVTDKLGLRLVGQGATRDGYGVDAGGNSLGYERSIAFRAQLLWKISSDIELLLSGDYNDLKSGGTVFKVTGVNPYPGIPGTPATASALVEILAESGMAATPANLAAAQATLSSYVNAGDRYFSAGNAFPQYSTFQGYGVAATVTANISSSIQFKSITAKRWIDRYSQNDLDATPYFIVHPVYKDVASNVSQELQLTGNMHPVKWLLGAYYNRESGNALSFNNSLGAINPANPSIDDGDVLSRSWAVFGQATVSFTDALRFTGGLRWTEETKGLYSRNRSGATGQICRIPAQVRINGACAAEFKNTFSDYSYLASLEWEPANGILTYVKSSRGFKGGGQNLRGSNTVASFQSYRPEIVTDYEVGLKVDAFDRRLRINAAAYLADYTDLQRSIRLQSGLTVVTLITNAAKARIKGAELEITAVPVDGLTLTASSGLTDAKYLIFVDATGDRSHEPFPFPKWTYTIGATYAVPLPNINIVANVNYDWRSTVTFGGGGAYNSQLTQVGYGLLNARLSAKLSSIGTEFSIFAKNLLNKSFYAAAVPFDRTLGFNVLGLGEPRMYGLEVTKRF